MKAKAKKKPARKQKRKSDLAAALEVWVLWKKCGCETFTEREIVAFLEGFNYGRGKHGR